MKRPLVKVVGAHVDERLVFNFAVAPEAMARVLPCDWLEPQVVGGVAIASFCMLWLERVTPKGWPSALMPSQVSCAIRFGVVDKTTGELGVYVVDRCTDSALGSLATRVGCPGFHPLVRVSDVGESPRKIEIARDGGAYMALEVFDASEEHGVFGSLEGFERFMADGARSYTMATSGDVMNVVDLKKEETRFVPHSAVVASGAGMTALFGDGCRLDSAYRATDARYEWTFIDQRPLVTGVSLVA